MFGRYVLHVKGYLYFITPGRTTLFEPIKTLLPIIIDELESCKEWSWWECMEDNIFAPAPIPTFDPKSIPLFASI